MVQILSLDVGIKHLAFCLLSKNDHEISSEWKITKWDVVDVSKKEKSVCSCCGKPAKFKKGETGYCLVHSKKQAFLPPMKEIKKSQKMTALMDIVHNYNIIIEANIKKDALVELLNDFREKNCYEPVNDVNASKIDLISIGTMIRDKFNDLFESVGKIDYILIENQISPIANRMKTIQGMIAQYFIMKNNFDHMEFVSAVNKLKEFETNKKLDYKERKKLGIQKCVENLEGIFKTSENMLEHFKTHKKKDDLADSFLQGLWFIHKNNL